MALTPTTGPIFKKDRRSSPCDRWFDAGVVLDFFDMKVGLVRHEGLV